MYSLPFGAQPRAVPFFLYYTKTGATRRDKNFERWIKIEKLLYKKQKTDAKREIFARQRVKIHLPDKVAV